ncbi:putative reverse transcriptase zinc-binding domain-containing protein [Helianthus anomalus]
MNRIPSKENLTIRGVQLASINCDRCGLRVESSQHILWECWTAKAVWWAILVWLRIPFPTTDLSVQELLGLVANQRGSKDWRKLVEAILMITIWVNSINCETNVRKTISLLSY